jgi:hypothetical protein
MLEPHAFDAETLNVPEVNAAEKFTTTEFVPCPLVMEALAGGVQLYVTPATFTTE